VRQAYEARVARARARAEAAIRAPVAGG